MFKFEVIETNFKLYELKKRLNDACTFIPIGECKYLVILNDDDVRFVLLTLKELGIKYYNLDIVD